MNTTVHGYARVTGRVVLHDAAARPGTGLPGVAVSDGVTVTTTDAEGRYSLDTDPQRRRTGLVHITVPAGYTAPTGEFGAPEFFRRVLLRPDEQTTADFVLRPDPSAGTDDYGFVVLADTHVQHGALNTREGLTRQLEQITAHAGEIDEASGRPRFVIVAGDLTNDASPGEFQDYLSALATSTIPVWSAPGNHDLTGRVPGGAARESSFPGDYRDIVDGYRQTLGPEWYSFQYGRHHYVVVENYLGLAQKDQLSWLAQDLATNAPGRQVVVISHVPWDVPQTPAPTLTTPYLDLFARYDVRLLLAGHTHTNDVVTGIVGQAVQAVTTSAAATQDQTPRGYRLVRFIDGRPSVEFSEFDADRNVTVVHPAGVVAAGSTRVWVDRYSPPGVPTELEYQVDSGPWRTLRPLGRRTWSHDLDLAAGEKQRHVRVRVRDRPGADWREHETTFVVGTEPVVTPPRQGEPWRMFHADAAHSGVAPDVVTPPLRPAWITHADGTILTSSPAVADETVVLGVRDEEGTSGCGVLALNLVDGRTRWRTPAPGSVDASVAVSGDLVLAPATRGPLLALDIGTGRTRWAWQPAHRDEPYCWMYYSPTVADGLVYQAYSVSSGAWVVALDVKTGEVTWRTDAPMGRNWFSHAAPAVCGDLVVYATAYANLVALDAATGALRWQNTLGAGLGVRAKPVIAGELILLACHGDLLMAVDSTTGRTVWTYRAPGESLLPGGGTAATPAVAGDLAYAAFTDGSVVAIDLHAGAEVWRYRAAGAVQSSPALSGTTIYVGSNDGRLTALDRRSGACQWHYELGSRVVSSPVVTGNTVISAAWSGLVCAFTEDAS